VRIPVGFDSTDVNPFRSERCLLDGNVPVDMHSCDRIRSLSSRFEFVQLVHQLKHLIIDLMVVVLNVG